jgi:hypothetical protein
MATATAAVRSLTDSFPKMSVTWLLTVASLMNSSRPISGLDSLDARLGGEHRAQALADDRVAIDDENADCHRDGPVPDGREASERARGSSAAGGERGRSTPMVGPAPGSARRCTAPFTCATRARMPPGPKPSVPAAGSRPRPSSVIRRATGSGR